MMKEDDIKISDDNLWSRISAKSSGTYVYDDKEFYEKNKNIKIVNSGGYMLENMVYW